MIATSVPGTGCQPLAVAVDVVAQRAERHDPAAAVAEPAPVRRGPDVPVVPPWLTPVFFSRDAAEAHQQIGVLGDHAQSVERLNRSSWVPTTRGMITPVAPRL